MESPENILNDIVPGEIPASQGQRYIGNLIDGILNAAVFAGMFFLVPSEYLVKFLNADFIYRLLLLLLIMFCFRFVFILLWGRSIGMIVARIKYLNKDLQPLTTSQKLMAAFIQKGNGISYYKV